MKIQIGKKKLSMLLCMLLLVSAVSCDSTSESGTAAEGSALPPVVESEAETLDPASVLDVPDMTWDGKAFRVLGMVSTAHANIFDSFEIYSEGENGDLVNDAVFRRNVAIEEKYNVVIEQTLAEREKDVAAFLRTSIMTGDDNYELAFMPLTSCGSLARDGYLYDIHTIDYVDLTKKWWNNTANSALEYNGKLYFASSDFALRDKSRCYFLAYNRDMAEQYDIEDPVALVRSGKWTIDKMNESMTAVSGDLNGNSALDDEDSFGLGLGSLNAVNQFMAGCNNLTMLSGSDGTFIPNIAGDRAIRSIDKIIELTSDQNKTVICDTWKGKTNIDKWSIAHSIFYTGRMLYVSSFADSLKSYSAKCDFNYGILPNPKLDEEQDTYYSYADQNCLLMCVPISCAAPEFAGFMLEVLSEASTNTTKKAFLETSCKVKYVYDEVSVEMLDIALSNVYYDPALIFNIAKISAMWENTIGSGNNTIASKYAAVENAVNTDIAKLLEDFSKEE